MPWRRRSCGRGDAADRAIMMLTTRVATVEPVGWSRHFVEDEWSFLGWLQRLVRLLQERMYPTAQAVAALDLRYRAMEASLYSLIESLKCVQRTFHRGGASDRLGSQVACEPHRQGLPRRRRQRGRPVAHVLGSPEGEAKRQSRLRDPQDT